MLEKVVYYSEDVFTVPGFFEPEACQAYIEEAERIGFDEAPITTAFGAVRAPDIRNNDRVMVDQPEVADSLWTRLSEYVQSKWEGWTAVGLNERLRFYRYDAGQQFDWHYDGYFERANGERSLFTLMIYLNDDFEGGETSFGPYAPSVGDCAADGLIIKPQAGMVLFFEHLKLHKGEPVAKGRKYVLRTDVMYQRLSS